MANDLRFPQRMDDENLIEDNVPSDVLLQFGINPIEFYTEGNMNSEKSSKNDDVPRMNKRYETLLDTFNRMRSEKKFDPWNTHNTMHFGKKKVILGVHIIPCILEKV
ncbi:hypothetical protein CEXT_471231 [Caerostris extrusa]|uniref:Uncharacterized protein n=1 Tax=Caerostris extrusa TaxID=172846 RepID=A0AAV4YDW6_CAEEX|nr:hypothetical protein CEXT_471231 [Caerostris extrusa]